jgi:hypothetical protein
MPGRDRRKKSRPAAVAGDTVRANLTLLPAELAELDGLALRLARPGWTANRSETVRALVRFALDAEADGLISIEDGRIGRARTMLG